MVFTEGMHTGEYLAEMAMGPSYHNDAVTVLSGQNLSAAAVVGAVPAGTSASAAKSGGNTGTGTFVLDVTTPILPRVKEGVYTARFTTTTNIRLEDPDGFIIADIPIVATNGQTAQINEQIKALVTQAATTFIVGDGFDITISALTEKVVEYNPAGTDGSQIMRGVLYGAVNATSSDKAGVVTSRGPVVLVADALVWKSGMTTAQKTTAKARLLARGLRAL